MHDMIRRISEHAFEAVDERFFLRRAVLAVGGKVLAKRKKSPPASL
jgi:hypothetical protein